MLYLGLNPGVMVEQSIESGKQPITTKPEKTEHLPEIGDVKAILQVLSEKLTLDSQRPTILYTPDNSMQERPTETGFEPIDIARNMDVQNPFPALEKKENKKNQKPKPDWDPDL